MSDIFIGYSRKDRGKAKVLARALQAVGWSVFWDVRVPTGSNWEKYLGQRVAEARCVVVAWSPAAVESEWVLEEAREGKKRGILAPVTFKDVEPPFGYRGIQTADLTAWNGEISASEFQQLAQDIGGLLGLPPERVEKNLQRVAMERKQKRSLAAKKGWETRRRKAKKRRVARRESRE